MAVRIAQMTWRTAPNNALVIDPAGRVWELAGRSTMPDGRPQAWLVDPEDPEIDCSVFPNPDDAVSVLIGDRPGPVATLSMYFQLERIG